ncbi:hypothetical protein [Phyllobacterium sophorae]|nr:hypothetical protein [Phyllobacterium sophorae]
MPTWPKDRLHKHGSDLPMEERVRRYQHNVCPPAIRLRRAD